MRGTGVFMPRTAEDIAALRQKSDSSTSTSSADARAPTSEAQKTPLSASYPMAKGLSSHPQRPAASSQHPHARLGTTPPQTSSGRFSPAASPGGQRIHSDTRPAGGWAVEGLSHRTAVGSCANNGEQLFSGSHSRNSAATLQLAPEQGCFVTSWDELEGASAAVRGSSGGGGPSSWNPAFSPTQPTPVCYLEHDNASAPRGDGSWASTTDQLVLVPAARHDDAAVPGTQDWLIPLGGSPSPFMLSGGGPISISSISPAQPAAVAQRASDASGSSDCSVETLLRLQAQLAAAKAAAGVSEALYPDYSGGAFACSPCPLQGMELAPRLTAHDAASLGWNTFAADASPLASHSFLQHQQHQHQHQQAVVSSAFMLGDLASLGGVSLAPASVPSALSAPSNCVGGLSLPNNLYGGGAGSFSNQSLLGSVATALPDSQRVLGNDVAAAAAAVAQDKLAQMQALEAMQQQLRDEVAHLLPLI